MAIGEDRRLREPVAVDEHARRMVARFLDSLRGYRDGQISVLDLSAQAQSVARSLDHASDPIPEMLLAVAAELEAMYFTSNEADQQAEADRVVAPLLGAIDASTGWQVAERLRGRGDVAVTTDEVLGLTRGED